jgi:heptosyltransferase III
MNHIVIIHMGAIGDLVQTFPALRAIRRRWPEARLTLVGRPERAVLALIAGLADERVDYDAVPVGGKAWAARFARADLFIDFLQLMPAGPEHPEVLTPAPLPPADWSDSAAAWIFQAVALPLDLPTGPLEPEIPVPESVVRSARTALNAAGIGGQFVAIHAGSGSIKKNWPLDRFAKIAARLRAAGRQPVWLSGPAERDRGTLGSASITDPVLADLPLGGLAGVLALANLYVGNDSGITQIAAAVRRPDGHAVPTVTLFGSTNPDVWAPRGKHVRLIRSDNGALDGIAIDRVWAAVAAALGK